MDNIHGIAVALKVYLVYLGYMYTLHTTQDET